MEWNGYENNFDYFTESYLSSLLMIYEKELPVGLTIYNIHPSSVDQAMLDCKKFTPKHYSEWHALNITDDDAGAHYANARCGGDYKFNDAQLDDAAAAEGKLILTADDDWVYIKKAE